MTDVIKSFEPMRAWAMNDPQLVEVLRLTGLGSYSRVLDVGCDSGGLLESLIAEAGLRPYGAFGVDPNRAAVEYGRSVCSDGVRLIVGEATDMMPRERFTHVVSVVVLMYAPQQKTIEAMASMVARGGRIVLVYETMRADFMWMTTQGLATALRAIRDFPYGVLTNLGWQPPPSILGRRAWVSTRRTRRQLEALGFRKEMLLPRRKGKRFLGKPTQQILVMRKDT
jgi:SAM-dependent methyltransferase